MRKRHGLFAIGFVLIGLLSLALHTPLTFWQSSLQKIVPPAIQLEAISGHLWQGQAQIRLATLTEPVQVYWQIESLWQPIQWQLQQPHFSAWGAIALGWQQWQLWVDDARLGVALFQPVANANQVRLDGVPMRIERLYVQIDPHKRVLSQWRGHGAWSQVNADYPVGNRRQQASLQHIRFEWGQDEANQPVLRVFDQQTNLLGSMLITPTNEAEIAIMPALIRAAGQRWNGAMDYPAMVMVQPLLP